MSLMFIKIVVDDLDAQAAFYATVLGQVARHRVARGEGDGAFEEIVTGTTESDGPSLLLLHYPRLETPPPGEAVLGFAVVDVEHTVRAAVAAGGAVRSGPTSMPSLGVCVAEIEDPEGHRLEIVQQL